MDFTQPLDLIAESALLNTNRDPRVDLAEDLNGAIPAEVARRIRWTCRIHLAQRKINIDQVEVATRTASNNAVVLQDILALVPNPCCPAGSRTQFITSVCYLFW